MKNIEVLGSGCKKCVKTAELIQTIAEEAGAQVNVVKETSPEALMKHRVMSTPAVVVDGVLVHSGSVPDKKDIVKWLV